jgi:AcrR family transcriptional regulator
MSSVQKPSITQTPITPTAGRANVKSPSQARACEPSPTARSAWFTSPPDEYVQVQAMPAATSGRTWGMNSVTRANARIVDVAARLITRNGARGTSLNDIATEAGVSQAGQLYHFGTKEALLNAVLDRHQVFTDDWLWGSGPDAGLKILQIIADYMASWPDQPQGASVYNILGMNTVVLAENVSEHADLHPRLVIGYRTTIDRVTATLHAAQRDARRRRCATQSHEDHRVHLRAWKPPGWSTRPFLSAPPPPNGPRSRPHFCRPTRPCCRHRSAGRFGVRRRDCALAWRT